MAELAYLGGVSPAVYSEQIRKHGMTWKQAIVLLRELRKLRDERMKVEIMFAKLVAGVRVK